MLLTGICRKIAVVLFLLVWWCPASVPAKPTTPDQARLVVQGWLAQDGTPLGTILGQKVTEVQSFQDAQKRNAYFVVSLAAGGFVVVPADDLVEPIIAFVPRGQFNPARDNPLGALVGRDVPQRVAGALALESQALMGGVPLQPRQFQEQARQKWQTLESQGLMSALPESQGLMTALPGVSDLRVDPLVQSKWSQETVGDPERNCYNYYTPNNDACGCPATALAQLLKYFEFPTSGVGTTEFQITVEGVARQEALRGGDGSGGPYEWNKMALVPGSATTDEELQAIGALTHDAGAAMNTKYASTGSEAYTEASALALVNTFKYTNAIAAVQTKIPIGNLIPMLNPNLDASLPVLLGVERTGTEGGHVVVADGYGYQTKTLYHHLNMGWGGSFDAWYNLPIIDLTPPEDYNVVGECVYNVYTGGSGEIISGRVVDAKGAPISGAAVQASKSGGGAYTASTNSRGIYALAQVPSASTYTITVSRGAYRFKPQVVATGTSEDGVNPAGNLWGINFAALSNVTPAVELLLLK